MPSEDSIFIDYSKKKLFYQNKPGAGMFTRINDYQVLLVFL